MAITLEGGSSTSFDRLEISDRLLFEAPADGRESSSMTMSAWFRIPADYSPTTTTSYRAFMGHRAQQFSNSNGSMVMSMSRPNMWAAESGANNGKQKPMRNADYGTTAAPTGEWVFATMTYDSESHYWNFYQNGELICSFDNGKAWALFQDHSESPLYLSTIFFVGGADIKIDLDEVQMFNRALSAEEVKTSMEAAQGMNGLVALYDFNDTPAVTGEYANVATGADAKTDIPAIVRQLTAKYTPANGEYTVNSYSSREPATVEGREVAETPDPQPVGSIDTITPDKLTATDQNYKEFSDLNAGSDARYAGQTAAGNDGCFNIRSSKNNSGIVTTQSGGRLKKVTITWGANASARTVRFYGKNTPYTAATDLYDSTKSGDVIGTLDYTEENGESVLILDKDVTYFGFRSVSSAIYIKKVVVEWENEPAPAMTEITLAEAENGTFRVLNGTEVLTSGSTVAPGTELTLEATPAEGYVLVNFTVNGQDIEGNTYTVTEEPATIGAVFAEVSYCVYPYTDKSNSNGRYTSALKITSDAGEQTVDNLQSALPPNDVYIDRTDAVVTLTQGETFTLSAVGKGSWMHCYLWIDLDNDKVFTPNLDPSNYKVLDGSELVSFSAYGGGLDRTFYSPAGEVTSNNQLWDAPLTYTIPADLPEGDYRARFIVDWDSADPCGAKLNGTKTIGANGGIMADFTIRIEKATVVTKKVTIATCDSELGTVAFVSPAVEGNVCDAEGEVTVKATPASDKVVFVDWTDADYNVISTEAEFTFTPEADITLTANFAKLYTLTTSVIGEGSVRITSDEEGTDEITLPVTLEEGTNVYAWFTPAEKYELTSAMIGGNEYLGTHHLQALENGAYRAIVGMYMDTEIVATYTSTVQPVYYELTSKVNGEGSVRVTSDEEGTEEIDLPATLEEETMFYVWFIPAEGNKLSSALVGGIEFIGSHHLEELENGVYRALTGMFTDTEIEATFIVDEAFSIDSIDADSLTDAEVYTLTGVR
ncbi:MAG: hypothetical protein K2F71_03350, partial [Paramuribaculum sp.]|nr:hypothetical protein [Paramuribaculum sp.]